MDLKNSVAVVTGGNGGLGQRICHALAQAGAHIAVVYAQSANEAGAVADEVRKHGVEADAFPCDVTKPAQIQKLVDDVMKLRYPLPLAVVPLIVPTMSVPAACVPLRLVANVPLVPSLSTSTSTVPALP